MIFQLNLIVFHDKATLELVIVTILVEQKRLQKRERQEKFIRNLKNALIRIENQTYGVCRVTGNLISKERLMLVPHATLSIEAKNSQ